MRPILKKRPVEVGCQSPAKSLAKNCNLKGGGHRQTRRDVGPVGLKTQVLSKPPLNASKASKSNADSPGQLSPAHSQSLTETLVKYTGKQKRGARLGEPQKAEEKRRSRVTFSLTPTDFGK